MRQKKLALSLRGGAIRSAGYVGVFKALDELGIKIDMMCGSSMGAIVGAAYAAKIPYETLLGFAEHMDARHLINLESFHDFSVIGDHTFKNLLAEVFGNKKLEDLEPRMFVQVTNLKKHTSEVLTKGHLKDVLLASSAFPILTVPVEIDGEFYIDGDVTSGYAADYLRKHGAEVVIGLSGGLDPHFTNNPNHFNLINRVAEPMMIALHHLKDIDLKLNPVDLLITDLGRDAGALQFSKSPELIDKAHQRVMRIKDKIEELVFY